MIEYIQWIQAFSRRLTILLAHNRKNEAQRLLNAAFQFRSQVVKDEYKFRVESIESILPCDVKWCRRLYRAGYRNISDLRDCTYQKLRDLGFPHSVAIGIMEAVNGYFVFTKHFGQ